MGQGWFESDEDYRIRIQQEANEQTIENSTGSAPRQGWFESDDAYRSRIGEEANERVVEDSTGSAPRQGWLESDSDYRTRMFEEANAHVVEGNTGSAPRQGWFESDDAYRSRVFKEANESAVEASADSPPRQGWFESDRDYRRRVALEAREIKAESGLSGSANCHVPNNQYESGTAEQDESADANQGRQTERKHKPRAAESLWSALSLAAEIKRNGGRLVRRNDDGSVEVLSLNSSSSGFDIVTMTYKKAEDYEWSQQVLAALEEQLAKPNK